MPKFKVTVYEDLAYNAVIEAKSAEEAKEMAEKYIEENGNLDGLGEGYELNVLNQSAEAFEIKD